MTALMHSILVSIILAGFPALAVIMVITLKVLTQKKQQKYILIKE